MTLCAFSANGAPTAHEIGVGSRQIDVALSINWGDQDERDNHAKVSSFCSFDCLSKWAAGRAIVHDGRTVVKAKEVLVG